MLEYEEALQDLGLNYNDLPTTLKGHITQLNNLISKSDNSPEYKHKIVLADLRLAENIQNFYEKDLPDAEVSEEEDDDNNNPNPNNMTEEQKALMARAKACGLPEAASEAQITAKEQEIANEKAKAEKEATDKADAEKAKAAKEIADKEELEKAEAAKIEKENKEKEAAARRAAESDILDDLDL